MATDSTSSSTAESCKKPVAPRNAIAIIMDDDEELIYTSEKSQREKLRTAKDVDNETSREEVVIKLEHDGEDESEYEASSEETIYTSERLGMNNKTTDDVIIDIMSRNDKNEGPLVVNYNYNDSKSLLV